MQPTNRRLALFSLGGFIALIALLRFPSDADSAWLLGYSRGRLLLAALMLLGIGLSAWGAWKLQQFPARLDQAIQRYSRPLRALALVALVFTADALYSILLWRPSPSPLALRLSPLLGWGLWGAALLLHYLNHEEHKGTQSEVSLRALRVPSWIPPTIWAWGALGALSLLVARTGLGIEPDITGWDTPGAPLRFAQLLLAIAAGLLLFRLLRPKNARGDLWLALIIWGSAALLWLRAPMQPSHYALEPGPPNFEFTPYSDAALLMVNAENYLLGEGFPFPAEKPLYNVLLAIFLALGKHHYLPAVNLQVLILALFPAAVYLVLTALNQRLAGILTAGVLILREANAIQLANRVNVSHAKLMMTDLPMALGVAAFTWLLLRWLERPPGWKRSLLTGGALGAVILIRSQATLFLPLAALLILLAQRRRWQSALRAWALFALGMLAVLLPWMLRNALVTGTFGYTQPVQAVYIESQYRFDPGVFRLLDLPPEERIRRGFGRALAFTCQHPGYVAHFIAAHFLHNEIAALLTLPMRFDLSATISAATDFAAFPSYPPGISAGRAYVDSLPYWDVNPHWRGGFSADTLIPLGINLLLLGLGLGTAWHAAGVRGLTPLFIHLTYNFSSAIARVSGSRFILPVDWILFAYYILGVTAILQGLNLAPRESAIPPRAAPHPQGIQPLRLIAATLALLALGALIPLGEILIPTRYAPATLEEAQTHFPPLACEGANHLALTGRALFRRFYKAQDGYGSGPWVAYNYFPYPRLGFYLAGPTNTNVILPLEEPPETFPQAADAIVIGSQKEGYLLAEAVVLRRDGQTWTYLAANCSP